MGDSTLGVEDATPKTSRLKEAATKPTPQRSLDNQIAVFTTELRLIFSPTIVIK